MTDHAFGSLSLGLSLAVLAVGIYAGCRGDLGPAPPAPAPAAPVVQQAPPPAPGHVVGQRPSLTDPYVPRPGREIYRARLEWNVEDEVCYLDMPGLLPNQHAYVDVPAAWCDDLKPWTPKPQEPK